MLNQSQYELDSLWIRFTMNKTHYESESLSYCSIRPNMNQSLSLNAQSGSLWIRGSLTAQSDSLWIRVCLSCCSIRLNMNQSFFLTAQSDSLLNSLTKAIAVPTLYFDSNGDKNKLLLSINYSNGSVVACEVFQYIFRGSLSILIHSELI